MRHWEEAGILTELVDRNAERLLAVDDCTIYWHLPGFLNLIEREPVLASFAVEYLDEVNRTQAELNERLATLLATLAELYVANADALRRLRQIVGGSKWDGLRFGQFDEDLGRAKERPAIEAVEKLADTLHLWIPFGLNQETQAWREPTLQSASEALESVRNGIKQLTVERQRLAEAHPGTALLGLQVYARTVDQSATEDGLSDVLANANAEEVRARIERASRFPRAHGAPIEQDVVRIHGLVRTLQLALAASLGKGQSRWAALRRFGARCEMFDRREISAELAADEGNGAKRGRPEAILTLRLARYLFDAGFNPLVDAAACGLRPDVLDATHQPAVYVEAKQYPQVGPAVANAIRGDLAQTINTWARLSKRWNVPEAFLVVFRRSGRPIRIENAQARVGGGHLYVLCVDIADASESGSQASEPVRVDIRALLGEPQ